MPRESLPPIGPGTFDQFERTDANDAPTLTRCPLCRGCGGVAVEVAEMFDRLIVVYEEKR